MYTYAYRWILYNEAVKNMYGEESPARKPYYIALYCNVFYFTMAAMGYCSLNIIQWNLYKPIAYSYE